MSQNPMKRFRVVFEHLETAESDDNQAIRLVELMEVQANELSEIEELRRLSEVLAEPEQRTYTVS